MRIINRRIAEDKVSAEWRENFLTHSTSRLCIPLPIIVWVINLFCFLPISYSANRQNEQNPSGSDEISIYQIAPDKRGGKAYKLVYLVSAQMDVFWRFKTDFDNNFLVRNKYIKEHHFIEQNGNKVITEDKYANGPDVYFRWQTTIFPLAKRMDFVLLNPKECRQKFHYGYIQLKSVPKGTQVTQVAYFDFWGVSLWAGYPRGGGMKDFLSYTAHWEQETIMHLKNRYDDKNSR
jgi:hypothetical protein